MIELDQRQIRLQAQPSDKVDAIRQVGQVLVASGHIEPGYIDSMLGREAVANTYLGNGIAIPHGLPQDRDLIKRTGIAVMQVPAGVTWNDGETVRLVVGIAAKSDEHIEVLRRLTRVLGDQAEVERLTQTQDPGDIIAALTGERPAAPPAQRHLPVSLRGLMPVLVLPFLATVLVGMLIIYVIGPPVAAINTALTAWLQGLQGVNAVLLGLILGAMMAFDMGGPVNKAAYAFGVGLLQSQIYTPMAAIMAAGMTPPLGLALAAFLFKDRFDVEEREAAKPAVALGISFITEGAIPFAAKDPLRVIPSLMLGSAVAAALSMVFRIGLLAPHGGIFVAFIPNAVTNPLLYVVAILAGTLVTTGALYITKRPIKAAVETAPEPAPATGRPINV